MKQYINGKYIDLTSEETTAMRDAAAQAEAEEKRRPLSFSGCRRCWYVSRSTR